MNTEAKTCLFSQISILGLRVFAASRSLNSMKALADIGSERIQLDVTSPASISQTRDEVARKTGGRLDILVNNAYVVLKMGGRSTRTNYETSVGGNVTEIHLLWAEKCGADLIQGWNIQQLRPRLLLSKTYLTSTCSEPWRWLSSLLHCYLLLKES